MHQCPNAVPHRLDVAQAATERPPQVGQRLEQAVVRRPSAEHLPASFGFATASLAAPGNRRCPRPPRQEDRARGGTVQFWLEKGHLTKYQVAIRVAGRRGNADVDGVVTTTVTVRGVGTAKVEVPAEAKKALD